MEAPADPVQDYIERTFGRLIKPGTTSKTPRTPWTKTSAWGRQRLSEHLDAEYGVPVQSLKELDSGVFTVELEDGRCWIARVFPAARPHIAVLEDAQLLQFLEFRGFPAERVAHDEPVSELDGQPVLITTFLNCARPTVSELERARMIGELLGRLHALPMKIPAAKRPAGAWHGSSPAGGSRRADVEALLPLLDFRISSSGPSRAAFKALREALASSDLCEDLPTALIHIDLGGPNVLTDEAGDPVVIDWAGAGQGPRILSMNALMGCATDDRLIDALIDGYRDHAAFNDKELARLGEALRVHTLVLDCWGAVVRPEGAEHAAALIGRKKALAHRVAARARLAMKSSPTARAAWRTAPCQHLLNPKFAGLVTAVEGRTDAELSDLAMQFEGLTRLCEIVFYSVAVVPHTLDCRVGFIVDGQHQWDVRVTNAVTKINRKVPASSPVTIRCTAPDLLRLVTGDPAWADALTSGRATIDGDIEHLDRLFGRPSPARKS